MNKTWTIVIVVLVIVAGVWWLNGGGSNLALAPGANTSASPTAVGATKTPVGYKATKSATPVPTPTITSSLSYTQLVAQYGSNRIQFDSDCKATPSSVVFKNGTSILLDNRSNQARTIVVNGRSYALVAYGYQVVTLSSSTLPQTLSLSCGDKVNVGTINLQANISGQ